MNKRFWLRSIGAAAVLLSLLLAACTRSASSGAVPTTAPATDAGGGGGGAETDPTMAALGTQVSADMTATAVEASMGGGGQVVEDVTDVPTVAAPEIPTETPVPPTPAPPTAPPAQAGCTNPYTVKQGDWIYKIARDCQVEPRALLAANPGINPDYIKPGQALNMPAAGATPSPACTGSYTVLQGDTLFRLAYNCGLLVEQLAAHNGITYPYLLHPGDVIRFP